MVALREGVAGAHEKPQGSEDSALRYRVGSCGLARVHLGLIAAEGFVDYAL